MTLNGKGYFLWQIPKCDGGDPARIAARSAAARLTHVLIKIADGANWVYNYDPARKIDFIPPVARALRDVGIQVWGWHYVRGDDPVGEARLAVQRMRALGLDGYVIDAEGEYKQSGKKAAAQRFMQELRAGLPRLPIGLSSYRFPQLHPQLPYSTFLERCDFAMPQVYFEYSHDPEEQLERCVAQYQALRPARPLVVTGPTYSRNAWRPTADEVLRFLRKTRRDGHSRRQLLGLRLCHPVDDARPLERGGFLQLAGGQPRRRHAREAAGTSQPEEPIPGGRPLPRQRRPRDPGPNHRRPAGGRSRGTSTCCGRCCPTPGSK